MPRKATQRQEPSMPDVLVPLSEIPEHQRGAYEIEAINDPDMFQKILSNENFFEMIAGFPDAWWSGGRLSMYLYRHENDDGLMIKNPVGEGNYIKPVIRQPVDRDWIANRNGGGKYQLWLNLSSPNPANPAKNISTTVKKYTFRIDGPPMVKEGQVIELGGKPVSVGGAAPAPVNDGGSTIDKVIDANTRANESSMEIVTKASTTAIEMVREQSRAASAPPAANPIQDKLMEAIIDKAFAAPVAPPANPLNDKLMEILMQRAFGEKEEPEHKETPLEQVDTIVQQVTGKTLADVARGNKAAPESEYGWVAPVADFGVKALAMLPNILNQMRQAKEEDFRRAIYLENLRNGKANNTAPPAAQSAAAQLPPAQPQTQEQPQAPPDRAQTVTMIVHRICQGFDRHRDLGSDIGATIAVEFGDLIEAHGLEPALADPKKMEAVLTEFPHLAMLLAARVTDARWRVFEPDLLGYFRDRWGTGEDDDEERPGPKAVDAPKPPAA